MRPLQTRQRINALCCGYLSPGKIIGAFFAGIASFIVPTDHTAEEGAEYLSRWVLGQTAKVFRLMNPGDTLIVDNCELLHARGDVGEDDLDRAIDRAYTQDIYG